MDDAGSSTATTFAGFPRADFDRLDGAHAVIFGAAEGSPYDPSRPSHSAGAPGALRTASQVFARQLAQLDFDLGFPLLADLQDRRGVVDCGDLPTHPTEAASNRTLIREATAKVLAAGAAPILLGGDDSTPIPFLQAFEGHGPIQVVQIDAHADWGDVIQGNALGYGSPMRRAAEMPWVRGMIQLGLRGLGSGGAWQIHDAQAWGSRLVTSHAVHAYGVEGALETAIPGGRFVVSIDCDGIDPGIFPAVAMPTPGGLTYEDMVAILKGLAARGEIVGVVIAEYVPHRDDPYRLCGQLAARIATVALGLMLGPPAG